MLFTPEMLEQLKAEAAEYGDYQPALEYYQHEIELAQKIMRGEMDVYAQNDLTGYIERIGRLEQLRQFARIHKCCCAYAVPKGMAFTGWIEGNRDIYDLGDFGEYGVEAGELLAYMLPYDGPEREPLAPGDGPIVVAEFASEAEVLEYLRSHSLFEKETEDE